MDVASPGAANGRPAAPSPTIAPSSLNGTIDTDVLVSHLVHLLEITLGASEEDLRAPGSLLSSAKREETVQRCQRFASGSQTALYVQKDMVAAEQNDGKICRSGQCHLS